MQIGYDRRLSLWDAERNFISCSSNTMENSSSTFVCKLGRAERTDKEENGRVWKRQIRESFSIRINQQWHPKCQD